MKATNRGYYRDQKSGAWVVQAARTTPSGKLIRRCKRIHGSEANARAVRQSMLTELDTEIRRILDSRLLEEQKKSAAKLLGIDPTTLTNKRAPATQQTLREFLVGRWAQQALVTQNETTRRTTRAHIGYLTFFIGKLRLADVDQAAVARVREGLWRDGPRSFAINQSGEPRRRRSEKFTPTAMNRILATLAAALNLAERERLIDRAPRVDLGAFGLDDDGRYEQLNAPYYEPSLSIQTIGGRGRCSWEHQDLPVHCALALRDRLKAVLGQLEEAIVQGGGQLPDD